MIELKNLSKTYISSRTESICALQNINLRLNKGEIVGILGKSGAGKSTLLRCVNLLEKPSSGQVIINGVDLTALSSHEIREYRHRIGFIFQHFNLLQSRNAFDNIALPLEILHVDKTEIKKRVTQLLDLVELSHKSNFYPHQLSGGQQQRIAIARGLAVNPYVLLCDEATSALDNTSTLSILNLLQKINSEFNLTILLITHELEVVKRICDRVAIIHQGELIETGKTLDVLTHPKNEVTKHLVKPKYDYHITHKDNTLTILLTFVGKDSDRPIISNLIKKFNVAINLVQAQIERIQNTTVGYTICEISGDTAEIKSALTYLQQTSIQVEIIDNE